MAKEMELASSAAEIEQEYWNQAQTRISEAEIKLAADLLEKKINDHYYEIAKKMLKRIWGDCERRTKHAQRSVATKDVYGSAKSYQCDICAAPVTRKDTIIGKRWKVDWKAISPGVKNVAGQLRAADRKAGIEWIP